MKGDVIIRWDVAASTGTPSEKHALVEAEVDRFDKLMQTVAGNEPLIKQERALIRSFLAAHLSGKIDEVR